MSAHILLNLTYELRKRDKIQGLPIIFSLFLNLLDKLNYTAEHILRSIYHMTLKSFLKLRFGMKMLRFCHMCSTLLWTSLHNILTLLNM